MCLVSGLLIVVQLGVLFQYLNVDILKFNSPKKGDKGMLRTLMYLLSTVNLIFIVIMYILLNYYSTDGWTPKTNEKHMKNKWKT